MMSIFKTSEIKTKYSIGEVLGTGNFGEVRLGTNKETGEKVAIKVIELKSADDEKITRSEVEILGSLHHPNIIGLIEIFEGKKSPMKVRKMYIVMELVTGGELFDRIVQKKTFKESEARSIIRTVFQSLEYMHSKGVVHRDLKPENILFANEADNSPIKIADFGLAKLYNPDIGGGEGLLKTKCGTPGYVAPEILRPKDKVKGYGEGVDVWSTGVILYILLCGFPPFYEDSQEVLFRQILKGNYDFPSPQWDNISKEAIDLVSQCLTTDPTKRITPAQALKHKWMTVDEAEISTEIETVVLKRYIRKEKFKRVKNAIVAVGRMQLAIQQTHN